MEENTIQTKVCTKCGRELPISEFQKSNNTKDGYRYECKDCRHEYMKQYNEKRKAQKQDEEAALKEIDKQPSKNAREDVVMSYLMTLPPRYLILALKRRGYEGHLTVVETKHINLDSFE